jgi:hypothetical protein
MTHDNKPSQTHMSGSGWSTRLNAMSPLRSNVVSLSADTSSCLASLQPLEKQIWLWHAKTDEDEADFALKSLCGWCQQHNNTMDKGHPSGDLPGETIPLNNESFYDNEKKACCEWELHNYFKYVLLSVNSCHHVHWQAIVIVVVAFMHSLVQCLFF